MEAKRLTALEKEVLVGLVEEKKDVVESKKTDSVALCGKTKAWKEIEVDFNRREGVTERTWQQLKRSWENVKAKRKRDLAAINQQRMATGGGPYLPQSVDTSPELEMIFPGIQQIIPDTGDCDEIPAVEGTAVSEVEEVPPTTSKQQEKRKRSFVEKEAEARLEKIRCLREEEAYICQMRRELLMMDMKAKEDECAAAAARRLTAENEAAASASLRAAADAKEVAAKILIEEARQRVVAATKLAANAEAAGRLEQELFELNKLESTRKMVDVTLHLFIILIVFGFGNPY